MKNRSPDITNASHFCGNCELSTFQSSLEWNVGNDSAANYWPETIQKKRTSERTNRNIMSSMSFTCWSKESRSSHISSPLMSRGRRGGNGSRLWKYRLSFVVTLIWPASVLPPLALPTRPVIKEDTIVLMNQQQE